MALKSMVYDLNRIRQRCLPRSVNAAFDRKSGSIKNFVRAARGDRKREREILASNIKALGYQQARLLQQSLPKPGQTTACSLGLSSRPTTQAEYGRPWFAHWCSELKIPVHFHRKIWEYVFVLQSLHDAGLLRDGTKGLGFACGQEPLPSYFASRGIDVVVTDLDPDSVRGTGWAETAQHAEKVDTLYYSDIVERSAFDAHVSLRYVDMNSIPADLKDYDFCWSICSLEHLGSIDKGLDFIKNSLSTVRPGGLSVHTTEYNYKNNAETIDNAPTVLFRRRDFENIAERLRAEGHEVAPISFDVGDDFLDTIVDLPPYSEDAHLKLSIQGFAVTCFGMVIRKKDA